MKRLTNQSDSVNAIRFTNFQGFRKAPWTLFCGLAFLILSHQANAQGDKTQKTYANIEVNFGAYRGFSFQVHHVSPKWFSFAAGATLASRGVTIPADYEPGLELPFDLDRFGFSNKPLRYHSHFHALAGKVFTSSKHPASRVNLLSGLSMGVFREVENWQFEGPGFLWANYSYDFTYHFRPSLMIQVKMEYLLNDKVGLSFAPLLQLNTHHTYYGFTVGAIAGKLR